MLTEYRETAADENATAYYPLLDRIAEGWLDDLDTEQKLYDKFVDILQSDGHITDPETLASFNLALSVRSAAPRIQAHYQFFETSVEPSLFGDQGKSCGVFVTLNGEQYCTPDTNDGDPRGKVANEHTDELPFDRILGNSSALPTIVYADITAPRFKLFHRTVSKSAREGKTSYRVRHRPSVWASSTPLVVNGYGVALQLKRTDYIVIDDRQEAHSDKDASQKPLATELDEDNSDLQPLAKDDVADLAEKAASFVLQSDQPMDTLLKMVRDFPKYTSTIAATNATSDFLTEHYSNRELLLPTGYNVIWINGVQIPAKDVNPYALLAHLRRERKLIHGIRSQGLSGPDTISLLSHSAITQGQTGDDPQRYDFRDEVEGGKVIVWVNNIEKDSRYQSWPEELRALLQRTYPGQLPNVRRDIHNAILPIDFTNSAHVSTVIDTIVGLVRRGIPLRWGLVPQTPNASAEEQAKIVYYLQHTYGLSAVTKYLLTSSEAKKLAAPDKASFETAVKAGTVRTDREGNARETLDFEDILVSEALGERVEKAKHYLDRLAANKPNAPAFVNGIPVALGDNWLSELSQRVSTDLRQIQQAVFEGSLKEDSWVPQQFLLQAAAKRNPLIIPENEKEVKLVNMAEFEEKYGKVFAQYPRVEAENTASKSEWAHLTVFGDFDTESGATLLKSVAQYRQANPNVEIVMVQNSDADQSSISDQLLDAYVDAKHQLDSNTLLKILSERVEKSQTSEKSTLLRKSAGALLEELELKAGQLAVLINGRFVGPIPEDKVFSFEDIEALVSYEKNKRIVPLSKALADLQLTEMIATPFDAAKIQSLVALSTVSDVPEGIFETASTLRTSVFGNWSADHTAIVKGTKENAIFQIVASIDPATETAQRWVPILNTLSEMDGTYLKLFLNPKQTLQELPVKRFYRYLLGSKPRFNADGSVDNFKAQFKGIPKKALLNLGMDVPPSWLVAPEESIHDLDNIKLSSLPAGADIDAVYGLESILIEGHSRDTTNGGQPPRGVEVVLSTDKNPHFADTIIMANLGYFQFKANPGFYSIQLKKGKSQDIFSLDSAGAKGWAAQPGDESNDLVLMSFQGTTLFPRLSRKPGQEDADILAEEGSVVSELATKGTEKVNKLLGKIGINFNSEKVFKKGAELLAGSKPASTQAEINIFSVASGHLYERMLNIMMLSVMKHTKHTVKFWFIEQFLSPSFKKFLPHMAAEYGFEYELVTYKWPHWLRQQSEKQREIWGYKILFLDVLFPLDLDKVIFVDADQIVRTDMYELVTHDLHGAPYGFTPMGDSRTSMEGFRFWKTGYWANFLRGKPYHISALYVVDLVRFRQLAAGDRLRQQYHSLSADPHSLSNLDQDLPNNMQFNLPIHSLPQEWLWCETWCADEDLATAKTIDLCNNPQTKEPKLDRARRQIPEWNVYDEEVAVLAKKISGGEKTVQQVVDVQAEEQVREKHEKDEERKRDEL